MLNDEIERSFILMNEAKYNEYNNQLITVLFYFLNN